MNKFEIFVLFIIIRLMSVIVVQTWFVPDEFWQSLEVAHKLTFNYGYLTWEWILGIRSYIHPLIIALVYKLLYLSYMDYASALIYIPRLLQALLSAYADYCFYKWSGSKKWAVFNISTAWFWFYVGSRTLINTLETALTVIALSQFPWNTKKNNSHNFLWIVIPLCFLRPTAAIQWFPLCIYYMAISRKPFLDVLLKKFFPIGVMALMATVALDSFAHGEFVITSYEFLKANLFNNVGEWYGTQPWHWYLSTGLPAILGIQFIPFILATSNIIRHRHIYQHDLALLGCIVFTLSVYSCLSHKEFRFILPLVPIILKINTSFLTRWSYKAAPFMIWLVAVVILVANIIPAMYLSIIHQRGALQLMEPLRTLAEKHPHNTSLLFLMPCHSTPFYSHLHVNITARFLTCEPNLHNNEFYVDEADNFYNSPNWWLRNNYPPNGTLPTHIITFDNLVLTLTDILSRYKRITKIFHTNLPSERVGKYIYIYERVIG